MRSFLTILLLITLALVEARAQTPPYMNYQGVARDRGGAVLQDQAISLRISVLKDGPNGTVAYSERHTVTTNDFGMFTLQIGAGDLRQGALDLLPWGSHGFWLQVEIDEEGGNNYALLGASQLLSVPYAFHALHADKADQLSSDASTGGSPGGTGGSAGSPWSTRGNEGTDAAFDFMGTSDRVDLVFGTDNIERMRLTAYGKLGIGTPDPQSTLDVKGNAAIGTDYAGMYAAPENGLLVQGQVGIGETFPNAMLEVGGELVVGQNFTGIHLPPLNGALFEGRVGIGTAGPGSMLSVKGGLSVGNSFSENQAPSNGAAFQGKVGIGTTIPKSWLGVAGNTSIGADYARSYEAPSNGLIVQGDVGFGTEAPLSRLGVAGNVSIGSTYASGYPAPEDGLMVEGPIWSGVFESDYAFHVIGNSFLDGTAEITGNTKIGGTLDVDGITTIHDLTDVPVITGLNEAAAQSFLGSLRTKGGAGVEKNLNVGEDLGVRRDAYVGRNLKVGGSANFKNLIVENYADIGRNPDPDYDADLNPDPQFPRTLINKGQTLLEKKVEITDETQSTGSNNGALTVSGGVGIEKNLNVGGQTTINYSSGSPSAGSASSYPLYVTGAGQGMAIQLSTGANSGNNYIGFWDNGGMRGSIQGETQAERLQSLDYILMTLGHVFDVTDAAVELISEVTDFRVGVGLGVVTVTPGVAKIVYATAKIILLAIQVGVEQAEYISSYGVAYKSGNADYAEWLEREDSSEQLVFGDLVGVRSGKISRRIEGADMVFVISKSPIVLGNTPPEGQEHLYEKCAFLGQVPVKVVGPVSPGDYIIPSGRDNGVGIAVSPSDLTAEQAGIVVGVSWEGIEAGVPGYVNVAVGMPVKAGVEVLKKQHESITTLQSRIGAMESVLRELIPDLDDRLARYGVDPGEDESVNASAPMAVAPVRDPVDPEPGLGKPDPDLITPDVFSRAIGIAKDDLRSRGMNPNDIPLIASLENDPGFRASYLAALKNMVRSGGDRTELERLMKTAN
ncbi:MAG: hypothetical protein KFH87_01435 [Bacteroidetes bacterium]|nr:hypothetical protein [Bacteroidota bacterium]